jgi:uncharacterized protein YjbI with pentapeptide repeats
MGTRQHNRTGVWQNPLLPGDCHTMLNETLRHLKYGATQWNAWRHGHPDAAVVLDGANLNGMILNGINFSHVSLRGASMHATNLMNADLRGADLSNANLSEADLIAANLHGAILRGANLHQADLLGANLTDVQCSPTDFAGALHAPSPPR